MTKKSAREFKLGILAAMATLYAGYAEAAPNLNLFLGPPGATAQFEIVWDGWRGTLRLPRPANLQAITSRPSGHLPISTTGALIHNGRSHRVTYWIGGAGESFCVTPGTCLLSWGIERGRGFFGPYANVVAGGVGYAKSGNNMLHRIAFAVDFAGTPSNATDDQIFEGYIFSNSAGFSGVTWWQSIPFGFSAKKQP